MSYDSCNECGAHPCRCDQEATGYECGECGYVPTHRELQRGSCPGCIEDRREARERAKGTATGALALLVMLLGLATSASAQPERNLADEEARSLFQAGVAAFDDARYDDALTYFRRAHQISGHPELLFNIGSAADRLRRDDVALEAFRAFLDEAPEDHPERRAVNVRVAAILAAQAEAAEETAQPPRVEPEPESEGTPPPPEPNAPPVGALVGSGVLTAGGATGVALALAGIARGGDCIARQDGDDSPCIERRETQWPTVGTLGALGVAALSAGVVWLVLTLTKSGDGAVGFNGSTLEVRF